MDYKSFGEVSLMNTEKVKEVTVDDILVASITYVGKYEECGEYIGRIFKASGAQAIGKPFCIYHDEEYKEDDAKIEVKKTLSVLLIFPLSSYLIQAITARKSKIRSSPLWIC